jgi:hypothetical protein
MSKPSVPADFFCIAACVKHFEAIPTPAIDLKVGCKSNTKHADYSADGNATSMKLEWAMRISVSHVQVIPLGTSHKPSQTSNLSKHVCHQPVHTTAIPTSHTNLIIFQTHPTPVHHPSSILSRLSFLPGCIPQRRGLRLDRDACTNHDARTSDSLGPR